MKCSGESHIREPFSLDQSTMTWLESKYPQVDRESTLERFIDWAKQKGVMYRDWNAGFRTVVRKGIDNGWRNIVVLKTTRISLLTELFNDGFRAPFEHESHKAYLTAHDMWLREKRYNVVPLKRAKG